MSSFTPVGADDGDEPDLTPFEGLDYAAEYTRELHAVLGAAGYDSELVVDPAVLGARQLGECVERHFAGVGVAVVHVLSHGDYTRKGGVYVVGSDAVKSTRTRVAEWCIAANDGSSAAMTVFLVDLCHAGQRSAPGSRPVPQSRREHG